MIALALLGCDPGRSLVDGRLGPCPSSPNCVTSEPGADPGHAIAPLPLGDPATAHDRLRATIGTFPDTAVVEARDDYVHATFTTPWMRFTDDVELRIDRDQGVVHVRSASRIGYGDRGVNRARIQAFAERWR